MARARNIKPSFFQNEQLGELSPVARLAFIGMWTIADFRGCIEWRPKRLKIQILPYDECNLEEIGIALEKSGLIRFYSVDEITYVKIINFEKHQNPHKNEKESGTNIPDFNEINELKQYGTTPDKNGTAPADSLLLIPDSLNLIPSTLIPDSVTPRKRRVEPEELQLACRQTWEAYGKAYFSRYGADPVRNASVNSQIKNFTKRIGFEDSPHVAAYFVENNLAYYVQRGHSVGCLLSDAEKLRTEWATGRSMTATRAKQIDQTQANFSVVGEAMKILERENAKVA